MRDLRKQSRWLFLLLVFSGMGYFPPAAVAAVPDLSPKFVQRFIDIVSSGDPRATTSTYAQEAELFTNMHPAAALMENNMGMRVKGKQDLFVYYTTLFRTFPALTTEVVYQAIDELVVTLEVTRTDRGDLTLQGFVVLVFTEKGMIARQSELWFDTLQLLSAWGVRQT